jgi:hypothetical protein
MQTQMDLIYGRELSRSVGNLISGGLAYESPEIEVQQVQLENSIAADSGTVTPTSTPDVGDWEDGGNNNGDISL